MESCSGMLCAQQSWNFLTVASLQLSWTWMELKATASGVISAQIWALCFHTCLWLLSWSQLSHVPLQPSGVSWPCQQPPGWLWMEARQTGHHQHHWLPKATFGVGWCDSRTQNSQSTGVVHTFKQPKQLFGRSLNDTLKQSCNSPPGPGCAWRWPVNVPRQSRAECQPSPCASCGFTVFPTFPFHKSSLSKFLQTPHCPSGGTRQGCVLETLLPLQPRFLQTLLFLYLILCSQDVTLAKLHPGKESTALHWKKPQTNTNSAGPKFFLCSLLLATLSHSLPSPMQQGTCHRRHFVHVFEAKF